MSGEILQSVFTRRVPIQDHELGQLALEIARSKTTLQVNGWLRKIEENRHLFRADQLSTLRASAERFREDLIEKVNPEEVGYVGLDAQGVPVSPKDLKIVAVSMGSDTFVTLSRKNETVAEKVRAALQDQLGLSAEEVRQLRLYFVQSDSGLTHTLALARLIADHEAPELGPFGIKDEGHRTDFVWELVARSEHLLNGQKPEEVLHGKFLSYYNSLKGFVATSGLKPMSQRALAIRDGRERPFGIFEGQGSNYLVELKDLIESEPSAQNLFNELKPIFAKHHIDLDDLLTLADADQSLIENYVAVNRVTVTLPVIALTQILRARAMEDYGFDFYDFTVLTGQSGGLPAAMFLAGSFEREDYIRPHVPMGIGGYHSLEAYRNFAEWICAEGRLMQMPPGKPNPIYYDPSVEKMEPLVKGREIPTLEDIETYFKKYHITNMAISGIPYDAEDQEFLYNPHQKVIDLKALLEAGGIATFRLWLLPKSPLGKILREINERDGSRSGIANSRVFVSNINTADTPMGEKSHFILVAGKGPALKELAQLILHKDATGYPEEIQEIVKGWKGDKSPVGVPITKTGVTFAPHDKIDLAGSVEALLKFAKEKGIRLSKPEVPVIHNWDTSNLQGAEDPARSLAEQQFTVQVDVPRIVRQAEQYGITSVMALGPGKYLTGTSLPANLHDTHLDILGVSGTDKTGVKDWTRLTTQDPRLAHALQIQPPQVSEPTIVEQISKIHGVRISEETSLKGNLITLKIQQELKPEDFTKLKELFFGLVPHSHILDFMGTEKIFVDGNLEANPLSRVLKNSPNLGFRFWVYPEGHGSLNIFENDRDVLEMLHNKGGIIVVAEQHKTGPDPGSMLSVIQRVYEAYHHVGAKDEFDTYRQVQMETFRRDTREAYARDWGLDIEGVKKDFVVHDVQVITLERLVDFAESLQSREEKFTNPGHPEFQAHPHFLINVLWKAMMTPAFSVELDLDFTRVIDESKSIKLGVPMVAGDEITVRARIVRVEDFKKGTYAGRRVIVEAKAVNQRQETVGEVVSAMVSRIPVDVADGTTKVIYENKELSDKIEFFKDQPVFQVAQEKEGKLVGGIPIAEGSLAIPKDLASTYTTDPNRIHVSDTLATMAGFGSGRIMQGLGTLAFVNEQVITHLQHAGLTRAYQGISNLNFSGFVFPGDELFYSVERVAHSEGDHQYRVTVSKSRLKEGKHVPFGGPVMTYDLMAQGPKTAVVFTGQGSQYVGMGDHLVADPTRKEFLKRLQSHVPLNEEDRPVVNLLDAMNGASQDTSQAQPMIMAYSYTVFKQMQASGLIPKDAVYSGHSLGMWIALLAAGAAPEKIAMKTVYQRGRAMQDFNNEANPQGMLAVISGGKVPPLDKIRLQLLQEFVNDPVDPNNRGIWSANDNSPNSIILGGHRSAIELAIPILVAWGYTTKSLGVRNAFHTPLLKGASEQFHVWMERHGNPFTIPNGTKLYMDIEGKRLDEVGNGDVAILADIMERQIASNVQWRATVRKMLADGVRRFIEIGPSSSFDKEKKIYEGNAGGTLVGMILREAEALGVQDKIEVVFANPMLNPKKWDQVTLQAKVEISEYHRPRIVVREAPNREELQRPEVPTEQTQVLENTSPTPTVVAVPSFLSVRPDQIQAAYDEFIIAKKGELSEGHLDHLAGELSQKYEALGPGAMVHLEALLHQLTPEPSTAPSGPSVHDRLVDYLVAATNRSKETIKGDMTLADLNVDSATQQTMAVELDELFDMEANPADLDKATVSKIASVYSAGAKGAGAKGTPVLSLEEQINKSAIEKVLPKLRVASQVQNTTVIGGADPVLVAELKDLIAKLEGRIVTLEKALAGGKPEGRDLDRPVIIAPDGEIGVASEMELKNLRQALENVTKGTSKFFVQELMQPHLDPDTVASKIYSFQEIEKNGGRQNLMAFIAWVRATVYEGLARADFEFEYGDLDRRVNRLANQLDTTSLTWLKRIIDGERVDYVSHILSRLFETAKRNLEAGTIQTEKVLTIRTVDHVPEYGSPQKTNAIPGLKTTGVLYDELADPSIADPKTQKDLQWLLQEGMDLRGREALVQEAGTMSTPLIAKLLQLGADVFVTRHTHRSHVRANGASENDFFSRLYGENAARGAKLTILPNMQPGNPHDEKVLLKHLDTIKAYPEIYINGAGKGDYGSPENRGDPHSVLAVMVLASRHMALQLAKRHQKAETGKKLVFLNFTSPNDGENLAQSDGDLIPSALAFSGHYDLAKQALGPGHTAAIAKANGIVDKKGHPILLEVSRKTGWGKSDGINPTLMSGNDYFTMSLEELDRQIEEEFKWLVAIGMGLFSPVTEQIRQKQSEGIEINRKVVTQIVDDLGDDFLKLAVLKHYEANGEVHALGLLEDALHQIKKSSEEELIPIFITLLKQITDPERRKVTVNLGNLEQAFSEILSQLASDIKANLKTLTGDEFATIQLSGVLAVLSGKRKGEHFDYDDTYGFRQAARKGILGYIVKTAQEIERKKHELAEPGWKERQIKEDPSRLPNDGSLIDLNHLNIAITDALRDHRYAVRSDDVLFPRDTITVNGYGMVGPHGPDALSNYRGMLAGSHFQTEDAELKWLGEKDFYNLARANGLDVKNWAIENIAQQVGISKETAKQAGGWDRTLKNYLNAHSGFQRIGEFVEFDTIADFKFTEDTEIPILSDKADEVEAKIRELKNFGYEILQRPDGSFYAWAEAGTIHKLPIKRRLPVTIVASLPGDSDFDFKRFGIIDMKDIRPESHGAQMAKMFVGQILMSMGGATPAEIAELFGPEYIYVAIGTGLGDLKPFNKMTTDPVLGAKKVPNYLMAGLLPDAAVGQIATEMLGATGLALAVIAACSTGNASIMMAIRHLLSRIVLDTRLTGEVDWSKVLRKISIAGGVDYAKTFNAVLGFDALGALLKDSYREGLDLPIEEGSQPDNAERGNFVLGVGGGGQALSTLQASRDLGLPVYGMVLGAAFRTDGDKTGQAREGYGQGQREALFEAWRDAKKYLTAHRFTKEQIKKDISRLAGAYSESVIVGEHFPKRSEMVLFMERLSEIFGVFIDRETLSHQTFKALVDLIYNQTTELKKNIKIIVMGHKTSTVAGDPYEEESLKIFLSSILSPGDFAHLVATKAFMGHALGGSSGIDAALTPLILRYGVIPGVPGLNNLGKHAADNPWILHNKDALSLREIYSPDTEFVVIREAAGFNAKNTAIVEYYGKIPFETVEEAQGYAKQLIERYARERTQRRAERLDLRPMTGYIQNYPNIPISQFKDLYELYLRSDAISKALLSGRQFDFEKILDWIYEFPVNKDVVIKVDTKRLFSLQTKIDNLVGELNVDKAAKAKGEAGLAEEAIKAKQEEIRLANLEADPLRYQYSFVKTADAYQELQKIRSELDPAKLKIIGDKLRAEGFDQQVLPFFGMSDGMGLRTLVTLIEAGVVKEVVGVHFDVDHYKISTYMPEVLKAYARSKGVTLKTFNKNGILYATRPDPARGIKAGDPLDMDPEIVAAINEARSRVTIKDINGYNSIAFGLPMRRTGADPMFVPHIDEFGRLKRLKVPTASSKEHEELATIRPMGRGNRRLLEAYQKHGWLGPKSRTITFDWWGSESENVLYGVYGGAVLGDAKNIQKKDLPVFARENPNSGSHTYFGFPSFLSFALFQIPGGTLTGLVAKRIYEDIANGVLKPEDFLKPTTMDLRFYSMTELAQEAVYKMALGEWGGTDANKIEADTHEKVIAVELDHRFKEVGQKLKVAITEKRNAFFKNNPDAKAGDFQEILTFEETVELIGEKYLPSDWRDYVHLWVRDLNEQKALLCEAKQEREGIEALPLPRALKTRYPFWQRAISSSVNTPKLAIEVIDAGGVGTLFASTLTPEALDSQVREVKKIVGVDAPLIVNIMMSHKDHPKQIEVLLKNKPAAVSFGNGFVTKEIADQLHQAAILVIQLMGTTRGTETLKKLEVDLVVAERNTGPGHYDAGPGSDPDVLFKKMRQKLYEDGIPVIGGGAFVDSENIKLAQYWGVSAIQLDDVIAYAAESSYAAKDILLSDAFKAEKAEPYVLEIVDEAGKPMRVLNTRGALALKSRLEDLRARQGINDETLKPLIGSLIASAMAKADNGDKENGLFFASADIAFVKVGESLASAFARLNGETDQPMDPQTPPNGGENGSGGGIRETDNSADIVFPDGSTAHISDADYIGSLDLAEDAELDGVGGDLENLGGVRIPMGTEFLPLKKALEEIRRLEGLKMHNQNQRILTGVTFNSTVRYLGMADVSQIAADVCLRNLGGILQDLPETYEGVDSTKVEIRFLLQQAIKLLENRINAITRPSTPVLVVDTKPSMDLASDEPTPRPSQSNGRGAGIPKTEPGEDPTTGLATGLDIYMKRESAPIFGNNALQIHSGLSPVNGNGILRMVSKKMVPNVGVVHESPLHGGSKQLQRFGIQNPLFRQGQKITRGGARFMLRK